MPSKGHIRVPDPVTEDVLRAVSLLSEQEIFTAKDIATRTNRDLHQVQNALNSKIRQGCLDRVSLGKYRKGGTRIKTKTPHGLVAEAVFAVLFTRSNNRPMRVREIAGEAETYTGRKIRPDSVSVILVYWDKQKAVIKYGDRGEYAYKLAPHITERPVTTRG